MRTCVAGSLISELVPKSKRIFPSAERNFLVGICCRIAPCCANCIVSTHSAEAAGKEGTSSFTGSIKPKPGFPFWTPGFHGSYHRPPTSDLRIAVFGNFFSGSRLLPAERAYHSPGHFGHALEAG